MIQLRGGIARLLQENRALALKPLRYVEDSSFFDFVTYCTLYGFGLSFVSV